MNSNSTGKSIKAVIFDLDGTLLDTLTDLHLSVNAALEAFGCKTHSRGDVCRFVGNGVYKLIERALPEGREDAHFEGVLGYFKEHYSEHMYDHTGAYVGIPEALAALRADGYKLAVVSNKFDSAVRELCRRYFSETIEVAAGENEAAGIRKKPAPDTVLAALAELGVNNEEAVYVGDSDVDVQTAKNAGMPCISVLWGFRDRAFLESEGATLFAETADELVRIVKEMK